jgi:hypothetical protein
MLMIIRGREKKPEGVVSVTRSAVPESDGAGVARSPELSAVGAQCHYLGMCMNRTPLTPHFAWLASRGIVTRP